MFAGDRVMRAYFQGAFGFGCGRTAKGIAFVQIADATERGSRAESRRTTNTASAAQA